MPLWLTLFVAAGADIEHAGEAAFVRSWDRIGERRGLDTGCIRERFVEPVFKAWILLRLEQVAVVRCEGSKPG